MADRKVSQLTALTGAGTASGDLLYIVDVSEPVAADQSKKITLTEFQSAPVSAGTANGVAYLNGSKVLTTGSALTFDGSKLGVGTSAPQTNLTIGNGGGNDLGVLLSRGATTNFYEAHDGTKTYIAGVDNTNDYVKIGSLSSHPVGFVTGNTEQMRLTSTGLGIGTSSPLTGLSLSKSGTQWTNNSSNTYPVPAGRTFLQMEAQASQANWFGFTGSYGTTSGSANLLLQVNLNNTNQQAGNYIGSEATSAASADLTFGRMVGGATTGSNSTKSEQMRLDTSGNLGLGVTPSAWSGWKAYQVDGGAVANIASVVTAVGGNWYADGVGDKYYANGAACRLDVNNSGEFQFKIAPSGTAGNAITFVQAMTLDASGRLLIGQTADKTQEVVRVSSSGQASLLLDNTGKTNGSFVGVFNDAALFGVNRNPSTGVFYNVSNYAAEMVAVGSSSTSYITFGTAAAANTAPTERARIDSSGNVGIGTTTPTEKLDVTGNIKASGSIIAPYIYAGNIATIGSFTWNTATSSPVAAINVGTTTVTPIHSGMRRCVMNDSGVVQYYLDPADSTKKADGSAANIDGTDGQVMVEIPAFYTRREVSGTFITWYVSPVELPGYTLHPAFTKDGSTVDFRYYSAYDACVYDVSASSYISGLNYDNNSGAGNGVEVDVTATTGDVLASVSGVYPMVGLTRAEFRTIAANRGTGWRQLDWALFSAVQLLYLIEHQSFFSQNILGAGNTDTTYAASSGTQSDNGASEAGKSNSLGNGSTNTTTGASSASRQVAFMSYRGIENFFGNDWNWADGVIVNPDGTASADQGDWWFTNNSADFSDSARTSMTQITAVGATGTGFISAIAAVDYFFVATSVSGGSSSTYLTDQYFGSTAADLVVVVGGLADIGASAGAFLVGASVDSSYRYRGVGARLAY